MCYGKLNDLFLEKVLLYIGLGVLIISTLSCTKKIPESARKKQEQQKKLSRLPNIKQVSIKESLAKTVKNPDLFPIYKISKYEYLDQNNLFKKINGAADGYVKNHGFVGCGYLELKHKIESISLIIYVMDMDKGIQGFGIYSSERNKDYQFVKVGSEGYYGSKSLTFWKNKYYIKIELHGKISSNKSKKLLLQLGQRFARLIPDNFTILKPFKQFPGKGRVKHGKRYYKANFASLGYLKNVFQVKYRSQKKDQHSSIFIAYLNNDKNAKKAMDKYKKDMNLKEIKNIIYSKSMKGYSAVDPIEKSLVSIFRTGKILVGVIGFSPKSLQEKMTNLMVNRLKKP